MKIDHESIGREIGKLVAEKNAAYGDSFKHSGKILELLYPNGIPPEKYTIALALVRILDKIFRLATNPDYNNENCWFDIAGYCILMMGYEREKKAKLDDILSRPNTLEIEDLIYKNPPPNHSGFIASGTPNPAEISSYWEGKSIKQVLEEVYGPLKASWEFEDKNMNFAMGSEPALNDAGIA